MPNHITNHVTIVGPKEKIDEIERAMFPLDDKGEPRFDFNGVAPMPLEIRETIHPQEVVETQEEADAINLKQPGRAIIQAQHDEWMAKYGATTWYDWAYKHWGTKWNAYSHEHFERAPDKDGLGRIDCTFDTAWGQPEHVLAAVADKWGVGVFATSFDEGDPTKPIRFEREYETGEHPLNIWDVHELEVSVTFAEIY